MVNVKEKHDEEKAPKEQRPLLGIAVIYHSSSFTSLSSTHSAGLSI
jgi:hypothetical protein